jgi:topoisomerase-4 subunit A
MLRISTENARFIAPELEIQLEELKNKWHFSTLEKIFIREEMYIDFKLYSDREALYKYMRSL